MLKVDVFDVGPCQSSSQYPSIGHAALLDEHVNDMEIIAGCATSAGERVSVPEQHQIRLIKRVRCWVHI